MTAPHDEARIEGADAPEAKDAAKTAAKVVASAALATSLVGALSEPPDTTLMQLPEPVPIVQQYYIADDDDDVDDERKKDTKTDRWRRILQLIRYLLIALLFVGTLLFGVLKGCAGIVAAPFLAQDDQQQEQQQQEEGEQAELPAVAAAAS